MGNVFHQGFEFSGDVLAFGHGWSPDSVIFSVPPHGGASEEWLNMSHNIEEAENERFPKLVEELLSECERWSMLLGYEGLYPWPGASLDTSSLPFGKKKG